MKKGIYIICMIIIFSISLSVFSGCNINNNKSINKNVSSETDCSQITSDQELINIALNISKEENNYTYWLFSPDKGVDDGNTIQKEITFTHNGEEFVSVCTYAMVKDFNSIDDFISHASEYLSTQYIENYLYMLIGIHSDNNISAPLLLESDGHLYKNTCPNGVSPVPNLKYEYGEVTEKTESTATVRLYVDPDSNIDICYIDYPLILEDGIWKHNPSWTFLF